jgi:hypothetical protein
MMSFNLYGWNALNNDVKATAIYADILDEDPDILGAQECEGKTTEISERTGLTPVGGEKHGLNIFYNPDIIQRLDSGYFNLNERDQWGQRIVIWAKFKHRESKNIFYQYNSHWCVCSEENLFNTAQTVASNMMSQYERDGFPAVFNGDLNVFAGFHNSKAIKYLSGFSVDGKTSPILLQDALPNGGSTFGAAGRIDYIFASASATVSNSRTLDQSGSDHRAIVTTVQFPNSVALVIDSSLDNIDRTADRPGGDNDVTDGDGDTGNNPLMLYGGVGIAAVIIVVAIATILKSKSDEPSRV